MAPIVGTGRPAPRALNPPSTCDRPYRLALVRRLAPLAIVLVFAAGCSTSRPGEKTVLPVPTKVTGTVVQCTSSSCRRSTRTVIRPPGKAVFTSAGCAACHTLADANATERSGRTSTQLKPPLPRRWSRR